MGDFFDAAEVNECHGNTEVWQCSKPCRRATWRAPLDYSFSVDLDTMLACKFPEDATDTDRVTPEEEGSEIPRVGHVKYSERLHMLKGLPEANDSNDEMQK